MHPSQTDISRNLLSKHFPKHSSKPLVFGSLVSRLHATGTSSYSRVAGTDDFWDLEVSNAPTAWGKSQVTFKKTQGAFHWRHLQLEITYICWFWKRIVTVAVYVCLVCNYTPWACILWWLHCEMSSLNILYFQLLQVPVPPTFLSKSWSHCWKVAPEGGYVKACRVITIPYRIHVDYTFPSGDGGCCCCCCCGWESSTWISRISKRSSNATETPGHWADELRDCFAAANEMPMIPWTPNETPSQLHEVVEVPKSLQDVFYCLSLNLLRDCTFTIVGLLIPLPIDVHAQSYCYLHINKFWLKPLLAD